MPFLDRPEPAEHRHSERSAPVATGTLACARCDAPVALAPGPHSPLERLWCPYCGNGGALREFLSLTPPSRPARVTVRVRSVGSPLGVDTRDDRRDRLGRAQRRAG